MTKKILLVIFFLTATMMKMKNTIYRTAQKGKRKHNQDQEYQILQNFTWNAELGPCLCGSQKGRSVGSLNLFSCIGNDIFLHIYDFLSPLSVSALGYVNSASKGALSKSSSYFGNNNVLSCIQGTDMAHLFWNSSTKILPL